MLLSRTMQWYKDNARSTYEIDDGMEQECRLVQGAVAGVAQVVLLVAVALALLWKRYQEFPQRPWNVWLLDVSKQGFSSLAAHVCGIIIAIVAARSSTVASECSWYLVAFTMDTTLGTAIAVAIHHMVVSFARRMHVTYKGMNDAAPPSWAVYFWDAIKDPGSYGTPISYRRWGIQLGEWVLATMVARMLVGTIMVLSAGVLQHVAGALDSGFEGHPRLLLFFVMVIVPITLNILQAVVQDQVLKWKRKQTGAGPLGSSCDCSSGSLLDANRSANTV